MTENGLFQIGLYLIVILICVKPLGFYMAQVYEGKTQYFYFIENFIYRLCLIDSKKEMGWKKYLSAMLIFNLLGVLAVYFIQRLQAYLPLNPQHFSAVPADLAFNTAVSFATNTDWQAYGGENTMSYLTQMLALTVQNFLSAATGMALLIAFIRGLIRHETMDLGNFWVDIVRTTLYILLPIAFIFAILLTSQGVIQNFKSYEKVDLIQPFSYQQQVTDSAGQSVKDEKGNPKMETIQVTQQTIPMGPAASQISIKQLGTNGGGFFNTNSAHPFENPTPIANFLEMVELLIIAAALCYTFGVMVKDTRQGWAIFLAMLIILVPLICCTVVAEQYGNPAFNQFHVTHNGNMEGKETRLGIVNSALFATATTATGCGAVNAMHDSFTPLGGLIPLWLMHLNEVVFGGVGSGLYAMLMLIVITVFIAGLMVGRTPEYLGKKIEPFEMKMASLAILIMPLIVLVFAGIAVVTKLGTDSIANPGAHGYTEILYAFTSMTNNNGSAFAGLNANTLFYNVVGSIAILIGRYWFAIPTLAIAGSLARKKIAPTNLGTLPTHTPLFIILLIGITVIVGALTFFPALALGPIVEQLMLWGQYGR